MLRFFDRVMSAVLLILAGGLLPGLATSAAQAPAGDTAFGAAAHSWDRAFDASGYYLPTGDITASGWVLDHIFIGAPEDFSEWEAEPTPSLIPIWLEFHYQDSPVVMGELGESYLDTKRVRANSFVVEPERLEIRALDPELNEVILSGMFHPDLFHVPGGVPSEEAALTGGAEINGERFRNVSFTHWLGD